MLASVASIALFSVSSSIITVQACDTPVPCYGGKGETFLLLTNGCMHFALLFSSIPVSSIKVRDRHMFLKSLSISISFCTSANSRIPPTFLHLDFVVISQEPVWHFKIPYLTTS